MKPYRVIALLTDFGRDTPYLAQLKGVILGINPTAVLIDLTHSVRPQGITEAAFILKTSYQYFPKGTIFLVVVDPGVGSGRKLICLATRDYLFLGPDNGVLSIIESPITLREITNQKYFRSPVSPTFHGRDILGPVAAYLSLGLNPTRLGPALRTIKKLLLPDPVVIGKTIRGEIIFIDHFGNLVTNIPLKLVKEQDYDKVVIKIKGKVIKGISQTYADKPVGQLMALFGSSDYLEIAVNQGSAAATLAPETQNSQRPRLILEVNIPTSRRIRGQ